MEGIQNNWEMQSLSMSPEQFLRQTTGGDFHYLARDSFSAFCLAVDERYRMADHVDIMHQAAELIESGDWDRVMISLPPRHSKTQTWSILFPAWFFGRNPHKKVMLVCHTQDLASRVGGFIKAFMTSPMYQAIFPECRLRSDSKAKADFTTTVGGEFFACGVTGGATGRGSDLLVIDDIFKDAIEAYSLITRQRVKDAYTSVFYPRLQPGAKVVMVGTRWHDDDLQGWLLDPTQQEEVEDWKLLNFPAIAENDEGWRKEGQALWPEQYPLHSLLRIKKAKGDWDWAAQYQGHPSAVEGILVKRAWWKRYAWNPHLAATRSLGALLTQPFRIYQSWDTAFEETEQADYSVCTTWLSTPSGEYLLDVWRQRANAPDLFAAAEALAYYWKPHAILVEKKASGHSLIQQLAVKTKLPVIPVNPEGKKFVRMQAVSPWIQSGRVFIPYDGTAPWVKDYLNELVSFPTGARDDQVDSTSQYLNYISQLLEQEKRWGHYDEPSAEINLYAV